MANVTAPLISASEMYSRASNAQWDRGHYIRTCYGAFDFFLTAKVNNHPRYVLCENVVGYNSPSISAENTAIKLMTGLNILAAATSVRVDNDGDFGVHMAHVEGIMSWLPDITVANKVYLYPGLAEGRALKFWYDEKVYHLS